MSDTPRTDEVFRDCPVGGDVVVYLLDHARRLERELAAALESLQFARLFIAEIGHSIVDPMYIETQNREGYAEDCKLFATGEVCAKYLDVKWQMERAIRAEAERDAAVKDAERYRWLRRNCRYSFDGSQEPQLVHATEDGPHQNASWRKDLDAAIDAAIAEGK